MYESLLAEARCMITSKSSQFSMCSRPVHHEVNLNILLHLLAFPNLAATWHQWISSNQLHIFVHGQALKFQGRILFANCSDSLIVFVLFCLIFLCVCMECGLRKKKEKNDHIFWERQERIPSCKKWTSGILSFSFSFYWDLRKTTIVTYINP